MDLGFVKEESQSGREIHFENSAAFVGRDDPARR